MQNGKCKNRKDSRPAIITMNMYFQTSESTKGGCFSWLGKA